MPSVFCYARRAHGCSSERYDLPFFSWLMYVHADRPQQTSRSRLEHFDLGLETGNRIKRAIWGNRTPQGYTPVKSLNEDIPLESSKANGISAPPKPVVKGVLPFRRIWTRNVLFTLTAGAFFDFQLGAFTNLWSLFLSTPRYVAGEATKTESKRSLPMLFTGGLGMPASTVGVATSILGVLGMFLQVSPYLSAERTSS